MHLSPTATLAVIDLQHIFADEDSDWYTPRFAEVIEPVSRLVEVFADRCVFTRFVAPSVIEGVWRDYYQQWPFALVPPDAPDYRLVAPFDRPEQRTVTASTFGKWAELAPLVGAAASGAELVLAGVSTDCCVLSTALAAADAGVRVLVVEQACAGVDDASHHRALAAMAMYAPLIEVVDLDRLLAAAGG